MKIIKTLVLAGAAVGIVASMASSAIAADRPMGFFITSVGIGKGGDLGGLKGADAHCTKLAQAAGSKRKTWRAYLSTQPKKGRGMSARDRIGSGPWYNAKGELIAVDVDQLHMPKYFKADSVGRKRQPGQRPWGQAQPT